MGVPDEQAGPEKPRRLVSLGSAHLHPSWSGTAGVHTHHTHAVSVRAHTHTQIINKEINNKEISQPLLHYMNSSVIANLGGQPDYIWNQLEPKLPGTLMTDFLNQII